MHIIRSFDTTFFDCDDTLVMWGDEQSEHALPFKNPDGMAIYMLVPNQRTIHALRQCHEAGGTVIVWSAGGWDWALEVVRVLGIEDRVHAVMSKPTRHYDDLPCTEWMGTRYDLQPIR